MRSALALLRALLALPGLCRALAAEARQTRAALLADGWSESAADAAIRGELPCPLQPFNLPPPPMRPFPFLLLALPALAAELPAPPPASALVPGPLHSATNLAPAEAAAAIAPALTPPSADAIAAFLAPAGRDMPAFETSSNWVDAVFLPLGMYERNVGRGTDAPFSIVLCTPEHARGVVWRWRRGTGPRAVPLDLEHDSATNAAYALMGRVVGAWYDETRGAVARIELTPAGLSAITNAAAPLRVSAQLRTVTSTNAAGDRISIPWSLRAIALTRDPALPTPVLRASDLRPLSEISVYPRAQ